MKYLSVDAFDKVCRVCFSETSLKPISALGKTHKEHNYSTNNSISELLILYLDIQFDENDKFPKNICKVCTSRLTEFYNFTRECYEKQTALEKVLCQAESNEEKCNNIKTEMEELYNEDSSINLSDVSACMENYGERIKPEIIEHSLLPETEFKPCLNELINKNSPEKMHGCLTKNQSYYSNNKTNVIEDNFLSKLDIEKSYNIKNESEELYNENDKEQCTSLSNTHSNERNVLEIFDKSVKLDILEPDLYPENECKVSNDSLTENMYESLTRTQTYCSINKITFLENGKKTFTCSYCNKSFTQRSSLITHTRKHTGEKPFTCSYCNKSFFRKSQLIAHIRIHTGEKPFTCSHCNMEFTIKSTLIAHIRKHTGENPFTCSYCNKSFFGKSHLTSHIRIHTGEKPYRCSHCNKSFTNQSILTAHIRIHTGEKPFTCSYCNKSFSYKSNLISHARRHTGEKPFTCSHCNMAFTNKSTLIAHIRKHTGEKPFTCSYCNQSFCHKLNLISHTRRHTGEKPFTCSYCNKSFFDKPKLTVHIRIHTGEDPFTCSYCNKSFSYESSLNSHFRRHTGEKPFTCSYCNKSFSNKSQLIQHFKRHKALL